jgi:hypothetical protein
MTSGFFGLYADGVIHKLAAGVTAVYSKAGIAYRHCRLCGIIRKILEGIQREDPRSLT